MVVTTTMEVMDGDGTAGIDGTIGDTVDILDMDGEVMVTHGALHTPMVTDMQIEVIMATEATVMYTIQEDVAITTEIR